MAGASRSGCRGTRCRSWSAGSCIGSASWTARSGRAPTISTSTRSIWSCIISAPSICRAFYFDIRKDALYCDPADAPTPACGAHGAARAAYSSHRLAGAGALLHRRGSLAAPALEKRRRRACICALLPTPPKSWRDDALAQRWNRLRDLRRVVTGAIEIERAAKRIGSSLQAHPTVYAPADYAAAVDGLDLAELAITSTATLRVEAPPPGAYMLPDLPEIGVVVAPAEGDKCERCWRVLTEVGHHGRAGLCERCTDALAAPGATAG